MVCRMPSSLILLNLRAIFIIFFVMKCWLNLLNCKIQLMPDAKAKVGKLVEEETFVTFCQWKIFMEVPNRSSTQ